MQKVDTLVIGAGPSGLALAYALQGNTVVVEKETSVGGLCRSITHDSGVFDIGGHSFHTPHPEVNTLVQELLPEGIYLQKREARVYSHGVIIPYPFQKYYDHLPDSEIVRQCEEGLAQVKGNADEADDFEEYIIRKFGAGIAEHFMLPYNRKLWARDINQISCEWTSERVASAKGVQEKFETSGGSRKPLQPDTRVGYPTKGGFEEIYRSFIPYIPELILDCEICHIDPANKVAKAKDGREFTYQTLVSSIPLPIMVRLVESTPKEIISIADALEYMSLRVELLLVGQPVQTDIQRIYIADPAISPHKIAINHNSSDFLRGQPHHAIMAEVSLSPQKKISVNDIAPQTISFLCQAGILNQPEDVIWTGHVDVKYAYPVYTHTRPGQVKRIKDYFHQLNIQTIGRFGDWEYINSDKCIYKGLQLGSRLQQLEKSLR